jgi:tRNA threonylcarbamoyladenosine biosynthesis protein TsaB
MSNKFIYSLLIDTSTKRSLISLNKDDRPISFNKIVWDKDLSATFFLSIKDLFEKNELLPKDLSFIAAGTGPGSYTGIRAGAASAKALSYALNIPLIGFCSLKCFIPEEPGPFYSLLDAKSGGVYLLEGNKDKSEVFYPKKPTLVSLNEIATYLKKSYFLVSPHMEELKEKLSFLAREKWVDSFPDPYHLAKLTFFKYKNSKISLSHKLQLLYLGGPGCN